MRSPNPDELRRAMAGLPTGVTIVTAPDGDGEATGATANAVTSLSLDPPLMLACLDRGSRTLAAILEADRFGISVLRAEQAALARAFATKLPHADKWREVERSSFGGVPVVEGALIWIACELRERHEGGDHVIVTGEVVALEAFEGEPLVFWAGVYRGLD